MTMGTPWEQVRAKYRFDEAELAAIRTAMEEELADEEQEQLARARSGDVVGPDEHTADGRWEEIQ